MTAPSWKGGDYFSKVVREGLCEEVPQAGHAPTSPHRAITPHTHITARITLCHYCLAWVLHEGNDPSQSSSGPQLLQRSAYSPQGNNAEEWMNERSWENLLMGRGIVTGPEVGKLSSKEPGRKP